MSYTQKWGISRNAFQSPLNDNGRRTIMEEPKSLTDDSGNAIKTVDYNKDIIKQNNEIAQGELRDDSEILKDQPGYNPTTGKIHSGGTLGAADWLMGPKAVTNIVSTTAALAPKILPFLKEGSKIFSKKFAAKKIDNL